jgi:hypothetical protein
LLSVPEFFGHFHPLLVHLPIGILLIALLLEWVSKFPRFVISVNVLRLVWLIGMLSAGLSCATGYLLSLSGDYEEQMVSWHMWMALVVFVLSVIIYLMVSKKQTGVLYKIFLFLLLILIMITGHLGGSLTHGSDYLVSPLSSRINADEFVQKPIPDIKEARVYSDIIRPILQTNCYSCHGRQRQKGGLRLDDSTWIAKGGKDGFIIHPYKPAESELVKRLLLPMDDEHRMPPKEKKPLSRNDIAIIEWWVRQGADFSQKVKELSRSPKIDAILLKKQAGQDTKDLSSEVNLVPEAPVDAADQKDIAQLEAKKVQIIPVAANSHYLSANFINAIDISDRDLALLLPLRKQLIWLKLGDQPVGDSGMVYVGQCSALTMLMLNNTGITDLGLQSLKNLHNLRVLNLVGTRVTPAGMISIKNLQQLNSVFLYKTKFSAGDWLSMKKSFPKTILDSGGYTVPFAAWDTIDEMRPKTK